MATVTEKGATCSGTLRRARHWPVRISICPVFHGVIQRGSLTAGRIGGGQFPAAPCALRHHASGASQKFRYRQRGHQGEGKQLYLGLGGYDVPALRRDGYMVDRIYGR